MKLSYEVRNIIEESKGTIFSVNFIKKDGTERKMVCRLNVKAGLRGGKSTTSHKTNLITVYDMQNKGYRNVNLDTVLTVKVRNKVYNVRKKEEVL